MMRHREAMEHIKVMPGEMVGYSVQAMPLEIGNGMTMEAPRTNVSVRGRVFQLETPSPCGVAVDLRHWMRWCLIWKECCNA